MQLTKLQKQKYKNIALDYLVPLVILTLIMLVMSSISPIYKYTYQITDFGATTSVAKAIGHGQVYMRDVFEQRGIYLYFIHIFVAFMPYGAAKAIIWLLETINLYGFYLLMRLMGIKFGAKPEKHSKKHYYSMWSLIITGLLPFSSTMANTASPEEWCIIGILYGMYLLMQFNKTQKISLKQSFIGGLLLGYMTNIKYSVVMTLAGFFLFYGLRLLFKKQIKEFIKVAGIAILGFITACVPMFVYFGANNSLLTYFKAYFIDNASSINTNTILLGSVYYLGMFGWFILLFVASISFAVKNFTKQTKIGFVAMAIMAILGATLIGRTGVAYPMPIDVIIMALALMGMPYAHKFYHNVKNKQEQIITKLILILQAVITVLFVAANINEQDFDTGALRVPNVNYYQENNRPYPSLQASFLIKKFGGGKILTYGTITNDIYMYNNEYPKLKYFDQTTMSYDRFPKSVRMQNKYLRRAEPTWIEYSSLISRRPKGMSIAQYNKAAKEFDKTYKALGKIKIAQVTAGISHIKKHPEKYVKTKWQEINQNGNIYYLEMTYPKDLIKNYYLVYLGLSKKGDTSRDYRNIGVGQWLWVKKSYADKHPELYDYIIDPMHVKETLNTKNSFVKYDKY